MSHAIIALKKAARDALTADAALTALLGGPRVHDEAPRAGEPPYAVLSEARSRDLSTNSGRAQEVTLGLAIWSRQGGTREALAIAARIETLLDGQALMLLPGFRLVSLSQTGTESRRPSRTEAYSCITRFRAYIEII